MTTLPFTSVVVLSAVLALASAQTSPQQTSALLALKSAWGSPQALSSWSSASDPCTYPTWLGIQCNPYVSPYIVTGIALQDLGLTGPALPPSLFSLTDLISLDLSNNTALSGTIPEAISQMSNLESILLPGCALDGPISPSVGSLPKLKVLNLKQNKMSGPLPMELGNLLSLYYFDITQNAFSGPLPSNMANITSLGHLHLAYNQLTAIPDNIANLRNLLHLLVDNNNISQPLPSGLLSMPNITLIHLSNNSFTLSDVTELEGRSPLYEFTASKAFGGNSLPLPDFSKMPASLQIIDLSYGGFNGSIPNTISALTNLFTLNLRKNFLEGGVPVELTAMTNIEDFDVSNNSLTEPVGNFNSLKSLKLHLENNSLAQVELANLNPTAGGDQNFQIFLYGNPVCQGSSINACLPSQCSEPWTPTPFCNDSSTADKCAALTSQAQSTGGSFMPNPAAGTQSCQCASPLQAYILLESPAFTTFTPERASLVQNITVTQLMTNVHISLEISQVYVSQVEYICLSTTHVQMVMTLNFFPLAGQASLDNNTVFQIKNFLRGAAWLYASSQFGLQSVREFVDPAPPPSSGGGLSGRQIAGIVVGCAAVVALVVALVAFVAYRHGQRVKDTWTKQDYMELDNIRLQGGVAKYKLRQLQEATEDFSEKRLLGEGGYGKVYKGVLPPGAPQAGEVVAVKQAKAAAQSSGTEFRNEIELLSRVHHRNLVGLLGYCREAGQELLVYEFIARGTLSEWLHPKGSEQHSGLSFNQRLVVALGSARGLEYLHCEISPPIIHRDIKSGNILLDEYLHAKVADFGLSKAVDEEQSEQGVETKIRGTAGYLDPEYYLTDLLTEKSDVYSFGIVLLELGTGWRVFENKQHIRSRVHQKVNELGILSIADPSMERPDPSTFESFIRLAMQCSTKKATARPSMQEVRKVLQEMQPGTGHAESDSSGVRSSFSHPHTAVSVDPDPDADFNPPMNNFSAGEFSEDSGAYIGPDGELYDNSGARFQSGVEAK